MTTKHELFLGTPLPAQKNVLGSYSTKQKLISLIVEELRNHYMHQSNIKMVITGPTTTTQSQSGECIERSDLKTLQEEADVIIIPQLMTAINESAECVKVICDDTDVFILLMHFYHHFKWTCNVLMEDTSGERTVISIPETVSKNSDIVGSLVAMHALSGCDTVPQMSGIGKKKSLNALNLRELVVSPG